jgi:hypothetical protein
MHDPVPHWKPPERMTPQERHDEIVAILSTGLRRMFAEQSSTLSTDCGDSLLDFANGRSGVRRHRIRQRTGG